MYDFEAFYCEVGAARSGTNFLGLVLASHPMLAYWRRPKYVWRHGNAWKPDDCLTADDASPRIRRYIRRRFWQYMKEREKDRLLVVTQANCLGLGFVNEVMPDGKIIHIIRDGRDCAASQAREWTIHVRPEAPKNLIFRRMLEVPVTDLPAYFGEFVGTMWRRLSGSKFRYSMGPKINDWKRLQREMDILEFSALNWATCVRAAREVGLGLPEGRYYEVRFEDLVAEPEKTVAELLVFMDLPPAEEVDHFIQQRVDRGRPGQYLSGLTQDQLDRIMPHMEDLLKELGYV